MIVFSALNIGIMQLTRLFFINLLENNFYNYTFNLQIFFELGLEISQITSKKYLVIPL